MQVYSTVFVPLTIFGIIFVTVEMFVEYVHWVQTVILYGMHNTVLPYLAISRIAYGIVYLEALIVIFL